MKLKLFLKIIKVYTEKMYEKKKMFLYTYLKCCLSNQGTIIHKPS